MARNDLQGYKKTLNSPYTGIKGWIDSRLPLIRMMEAEYLKFPVPKSLNYFWSFGGIAMFWTDRSRLVGESTDGLLARRQCTI